MFIWWPSRCSLLSPFGLFLCMCVSVRPCPLSQWRLQPVHCTQSGQIIVLSNIYKKNAFAFFGFLFTPYTPTAPHSLTSRHSTNRKTSSMKTNYNKWSSIWGFARTLDYPDLNLTDQTWDELFWKQSMDDEGYKTNQVRLWSVCRKPPSLSLPFRRPGQVVRRELCLSSTNRLFEISLGIKT